MTPAPKSPFKGKTGWRRIRNAAGYSAAGLRDAFRLEDAFRQEVGLALVLVPVAFGLPVGGAERALMIGVVLLMLIVELLNSSLEAAVDRVSLETHVLARQAKDIGSAAVLLALVNAAVTWALILIG